MRTTRVILLLVTIIVTALVVVRPAGQVEEVPLRAVYDEDDLPHGLHDPLLTLDATDPPPKVNNNNTSTLCKSLPIHANSTGQWFVEWCHVDRADMCSGTLTIRRRKGCLISPGRLLSKNATLSKEIEQSHGPDHYRVRISGPEVVIVEPRYMGTGSPDCEYTATYSLMYPGKHPLAIELLYDHYYALDEATIHWPPLRKRPLLPLRSMPHYRWYHTSQITPESIVDIPCINLVPPSRKKLPPCSVSEANMGRWVRDSAKGPLTTRVRVKKIRRQPILFQWESQQEAFYEWLPDTCNLRVFPQECLRKKKAIIGGDSQLRALYFTALNILRGHGVTCVQNVTATSEESAHCIANVKGGQHYRVSPSEIQLDFMDDSFFSRIPGKYTSYDAVIVGYAQHPASKEHWPLDRYRRELPGKAQFLADLIKIGKNVVWYAAPQYPHSTSGYPIMVMDWRTDLRLATMNRYARVYMSQRGIPVVDSYAVSTGFSHTSPDQAHYHNWVMYNIVNLVLNALCR